MAFFTIEPFGERAADMRNGLLACTLANIHCADRSRTFTIQDFMISGERKQRTPEEMEAAMMRWAKRHNNQLKGKA